ncbi:MAG TPA: hypothetical protein VLY03_06680 [Bacteroidota bacterium]|nr:hypothetical protein [Bacteroidota bacterium]
MPRTHTPSDEQQVAPELKERRYIYGGEGPRPSPEFAPRGNRRAPARGRSPLRLLTLLFGVSLLIVVYVWNKITVDRLVVEVNDLQLQYAKLADANEVLRAEINRKSGLERIGKKATEQLHLISPPQQPLWFSIDADRLKDIQQ